jgi:transcription elongation factor GreA
LQRPVQGAILPRTMTASDDILLDELGSSASSGGSGAAYDDTGEETIVTKEGLKKLKEELENLKNVRRKEVAQRLKEAISYGDLSENSEYEEAKNEQAFVEGRIIDLERKIKSAKVISEKDGKVKDVNVGTTVTIRNISESDAEDETYTIVGATEADPFENKISNESPIGKALLSHIRGDEVEVQSPSGTDRYEILKVS